MIIINDLLGLVSTTIVIDEYGFEKTEEQIEEVFAKEKSVRSSEFYEAQSRGYKLDRMFVIKPYEYNNQAIVCYEGHKYKVERTYKVDTEKLELICSRII